jgi:hypothetical protein
MSGNNMTAEVIQAEISNMRHMTKSRFRQVNRKAGEYAYATDNTFEQEMYFGNAGVGVRAEETRASWDKNSCGWG